MILRNYLNFIFTCIFLLFHTTACANSSLQKPQVFDNVRSEVSFRKWNEKGLGKVIGHNTISVVKAGKHVGDIVILRWSEDHSKFRAEVYRPEDATEPVTVWNLVSDTEEKILTDQHGQFYLIVELVAGEDGGQKTERFKLTEEK